MPLLKISDSHSINTASNRIQFVIKTAGKFITSRLVALQ